MNFDNRLTAKAMSGRVNNKYYKLPTMARYSDGSESGEPEFKVISGVVGNGVRTGFASIMSFRYNLHTKEIRKLPEIF